MFRALWQRIAGLFGGKKQQHRPVPGGIPAPATLVARVAAANDKDREMLRLANEAIRRGHPDQAVIAYWKAVKKYLGDGQLLKAVSALKMILKQAPDDAEAFMTLIETYVSLERNRDAAAVCIQAADMHVERGRRDEGLGLLLRALEIDPMIKGARERVSALGGKLPNQADSNSAIKLKLEAKQIEPEEEAPSGPAIQPIPLSPLEQPAGVQAAGPGLSDPSGPLELDIAGDEDSDFPDDSLVVPVGDSGSAAVAEPAIPPLLDADLDLPDLDETAEEEASGDATVMGMSTIEPQMHEADEGAATVMGMSAVDLEEETAPPEVDDGAATVMGMSAITSEQIAQHRIEMGNETEPSPVVERRPRFNIPEQATRAEAGLPSAVLGTEHDPSSDLPPTKPADPTKPAEPEIGGSTRAYAPDELRALGIQVPTPEE